MLDGIAQVCGKLEGGNSFSQYVDCTGGSIIAAAIALTFTGWGMRFVFRVVAYGWDRLTWLVRPGYDWLYKRLNPNVPVPPPTIANPGEVPSTPWWGNVILISILAAYWALSVLGTQGTK